MKRIFAALILLVYFMVSTGFAVSVHYCMDEFDSANIGSSTDDTCNRCGMDTGENNCCRDEVKMHKLETSHTVSKAFDLNFSMQVLLVATNDFVLSPFRNFKPYTQSISHSPPINGQDIHIENCVFRI